MEAFDIWLKRLKDAQSEARVNEIFHGIATAEATHEITSVEASRLYVVANLALLACLWREEAFSKLEKNYTT